MTRIPPALASWILRYLANRNEALEGDLLEEFHQGRSASWYWRQVLRALLLSFSAPLRTGWRVIWTVVFPVVWCTGMNEFTHLAALSPLMVALNDWLRHEGSCGFALLNALVIIVCVAVPLAIYLALTNKLTGRTFVAGLVGGSTGLGIMLFILMNRIVFLQPMYRPLNTPLNALFAFARAEHWNIRRWLGVCARYQLSLPLFAAICATQIRMSALKQLPGALATTVRNAMLGTPSRARCE